MWIINFIDTADTVITPTSHTQIPHHITPHHTKSHHTTPNHTTPHQITPHHTKSHTTPNHTTSNHTPHTTPHQITPHHTKSHHTTPNHITLKRTSQSSLPNSVHLKSCNKKMASKQNYFLMRNNKQVDILTRRLIIFSVASYMFRPPAVAIFREVLFEGILHRTLKPFTDTKC